MTLVEVLVAVVVCGAGLVIAASAVAAALNAEGHADDLSRAATHLELLLGKVESGVVALEADEGDFTEEGAPELKWSITVEPGEREGLTDVQLSVKWTRLNQERDLTVTRLVFTDPNAGTQ
jgi:hypothetical protein